MYRLVRKVHHTISVSAIAANIVLNCVRSHENNGARRALHLDSELRKTSVPPAKASQCDDSTPPQTNVLQIFVVVGVGIHH